MIDKILTGEETPEPGSTQVEYQRDYQLRGHPTEDYYDKPNPKWMDDPFGEPMESGFQKLNVLDVVARTEDIGKKKSKYLKRYGNETLPLAKGGVAKKKKKKKKRGY